MNHNGAQWLTQSSISALPKCGVKLNFKIVASGLDSNESMEILGQKELDFLLKIEMVEDVRKAICMHTIKCLRKQFACLALSV